MKEIVELKYNWHQVELGEDYYIVKVGENGVVKIEGHAAAGEGDKWYYDIYYNDNTITRTFNPNQVKYAESKN